MSRPNCQDFRQLFINDTPLMDMRAPVEFAQGAYPSSLNLPLMQDEERKAVGTCYKEQGQEAAIALGHALVNGEVKAERVAQWKAFCEANPNGYLYCFRGGLRSRITQQWLKEAGIDYPFVEGGYKALRRFLLEIIDDVATKPMTLIGGNTGCGKTIMINELANGIDLEGAANHRGSSFGRYVSAQRTQINFENVLAISMLKKQAAGVSHFAYEDEGKIIGSVSVPLPIVQAMQAAPIAIVDDPLDVRLERLLGDYVVKMQRDFCAEFGEQEGWEHFAQYLERGMFSIRKRLGYQRYEELLLVQQQAVKVMQSSGELSGHYDWLSLLLEQYYDPMYTYQLSKKADRIVYRGKYADVKAWLAENCV
ncbi:tRNA 2-selenouridine(34) synthase MnmH [Photobacterium lutimaris]|uniref:tRNA 2-selenouridine synthase n=1 Tax=Photobacterium lutimaris TaxID=388278 RepID=A0A2T3IVG3_9GAMM|nr:tRNA 2-selenouridine(34) synthase MnmH [Photobacterium lutimaris]PSU32398.1 tRNA 2-selenouridine(34) synthase MnmH [Photobacterium lutimaris]TDR77597.1 tRNA 2-selenouridine synthase [Photobacterium lutimaris]